MAYNAPSTRSTGDLINATIWNADIVANIIAVYAGGLSITSQAVGDILYASSTTQTGRVAAVAAGQVLTSAGTGTVPAYSATPALTSVDMGSTTVYGSRAITVDTGGVLNVVLASAAGDDFTVDTDKLVVSGDTGYIGIGVTAPTVALDVMSSNGEARIARNGTSSFDMGQLYLGGKDSAGNLQDYALIGSKALDSTSGTEDGALIFHIALNASLIERMRIVSSGNVGIGTSSPSAYADLTLESGALALKERATPTADTNYGKVYTKTDNKLYFQDGAGTEHEIAFA